MLKYDLHTHTNYSKCSNMEPELLLKIAKKRKLDGIAVTDHHKIEGALKTRELNKDKNFEVIIGTEISTRQGDVLCYYISKKIESLDFFDVVEEVKKQDGLIVIPHPFRTSTNPHHKFKIPFDKIKNKVDAIECFNSRMLFESNNNKAEDIASRLKMAKTAGSDAHFSFEVARACTIFDEDLRKALKERKTKCIGTRLYGPFGGLLSFIRNRIY